MKLHRSDQIATTAVVVLFVGFLAYCGVRSAYKPDHDETIEQHINHADTFYWFAMAARGYMEYLIDGEEYVELAREELEHAPENEREELEERIDGIAQDLKYQRTLHHDTLHGVFPWSHYIAKPTLFKDPRATGLYELNDQPEVVAARSAVNNLVREVLDHQTMTAQFDVVFVAEPAEDTPAHSEDSPAHAEDEPAHADDSPAHSEEARAHSEETPAHSTSAHSHEAPADPAQLENEALYLFNLDPRFFVHNMLEVSGTLTPEEQNQLRQLEPTAEVLTKLSDAWGQRDLLVVRIKKNDEVHHYHFYSAQGRLYSGLSPVPAAVYNNYGFCADRRFVRGAVVFFNLLMLIAAVVLFRLLSQFVAHDGLPPSWKDSIGLGVIGFLWGRVAVWGLAEIVEEFAPGDENLAYLAFWWPAVTGVVMLLGPGLIIRFAEARFGWLDRTFSLFNRRGALFAAVTMGSAAYVGQVALWVRYWGGWPLLPPLVLAAVCAAWILGRALDQTDPVKGKWGAIVVILTLGIGLAFSNSFPPGLHHWKLWAAAVPILFTGAVAVRQSSQFIRAEVSGTGRDAREGASVDSVQELMRLAEDPPFQENRSSREVREHLADWLEGKTVRMQLVGVAGTGKTAVLDELRRTYSCDGSVAVMTAACPEPQEGSSPEPYRPFADAIADHFSVNLLAPSAELQLGIDKAVDGIFEEVVPFSDLLFPPGQGEGASGSKQELYASVASMLRHLSRKRPLMLVLDDAHWFDSGSRELLGFLLDRFPAGEETPVAIIVASRSADSGFGSDETITVEPLTSTEVCTLLVDSLQIAPEPARELAQALGDEAGNLHWLFQMVRDLAGKEVLQWTDDGWDWDSGTNLAEHLPDDMRQSIWLTLKEHPEFRPVVECAACMGPEFTLDVLSPAVDMTRLECIQLLDRIEEETGFVHDVQEEDDTFAFRSPFLLEVIRSLLDVNASGPAQPSPQRIREYHARLADAWESTLGRTSATTYRLATHRYAAGARHAEQATRELLNAARAASAQYQHDQARQYLGMARECASVAGLDSHELERELLLIECHEAHVEGRHRVEVAERARNVLAEDPDSDFEVYEAAALACYDAGVDTRKQEHFASCVDLGRTIVNRFPQPLQQAHGHHFIGIGLPVREAEQRRRSLERAMHAVELAGEGPDALRLKSRIANSLAEQLSYGSDDDRDTARNLFLTSIELKNRPEIRDVEGLAIAHGGLGRLAFFDARPDYDDARAHFEKDLSYSERIASRNSQSKMHSLLGACDIRQHQDFESARKHYEAALEMADEVVDRMFALSGLLECSGSLSDGENVSRYGQRLQELMQSTVNDFADDSRVENPRGAIPGMCLDSIRAGLAACSAQRDAQWHRWISVLIDENRIAD